MSEPDTSSRPARRRRLLRWLIAGAAVAIAAAFTGLLAYGVVAQNPTTTIDDNLAHGQSTPAPPFHLAVLQPGSLGPLLEPKLGANLTQRWLSLSELRGTPIVLNVWASWCVPCQQEAPTLERAWRAQARPRGVLFLGLDMQDATIDAHTFMRHYHVDYPNIRDHSNDVPLSYGVTGVPETFFISSQGRIVGHIIGVSTTAQLTAGIRAARNGNVQDTLQGGAQGSFQ
jgi:cytochrome c biogenesis protein CcmG/thiol:disulfide interchange protein DsbE